jgi:ribonucleoside-diphosphate reductase beta chain
MRDEQKEENPVEELADEFAGADSLVGPVELFDRWEKQAWTTRELKMERDRTDWGSLGPFTLRELRLRLYQFLLGEAAVTKTLPALTLAAPTQAAQCFLATQAADEARHTIFFLRYLRAIGETEGSDVDALAESWSISVSASHSQFFDSELVRVTEAVRINPSDRGAWMAGITIYHLLTEAVLAIAGQRGIIRTARRTQRLPVLTRGALNIARDESRHIAFGVRALRDGVHEGHGDVVAGMVCEQIPLLTAILVGPEQRLPQLVPGALRPFVDEVSAGWDSAFDALAKRLRLIGLDAVVRDADRLWQSGIRHALEDYHARHGVAHPATAFGQTGTGVPEVAVPSAGGNV